MTCEFCRRLQKDGFEKVKCEGIEKVDECETGKVTKLHPGNRPFWWLFQRILPGLFGAYGAVNYSAIDSIFSLYGIDPGQRPVLHDNCLICINVIKEIWEKERSKNG